MKQVGAIVLAAMALLAATPALAWTDGVSVAPDASPPPAGMTCDQLHAASDQAESEDAAAQAEFRSVTQRALEDRAIIKKADRDSSTILKVVAAHNINAAMAQFRRGSAVAVNLEADIINLKILKFRTQTMPAALAAVDDVQVRLQRMKSLTTSMDYLIDQREMTETAIEALDAKLLRATLFEPVNQRCEWRTFDASKERDVVFRMVMDAYAPFNDD